MLVRGLPDRNCVGATTAHNLHTPALSYKISKGSATALDRGDFGLPSFLRRGTQGEVPQNAGGGFLIRKSDYSPLIRGVASGSVGRRGVSEKRLLQRSLFEASSG